MLDAAVKALSQMLSPPFRTVLLKSVGLAILLLFVLFIVL
jgi:CysZ protein